MEGQLLYQVTYRLYNQKEQNTCTMVAGSPQEAEGRTVALTENRAKGITVSLKGQKPRPAIRLEDVSGKPYSGEAPFLKTYKEPRRK